MTNFYVHIIESPSPEDVQSGRKEGTLISEFLKLAGIQSKYDLTVSYDEFMKSIQNRLADATVEYQKYPILHFSTHGDENGLKLTDGTLLEWDHLRSFFYPINMLMKGQFVLSFSSCRGFSACKMAMKFDGKIPFGALVGPLRDIPWDESAIAFMVFYNRLAKDNNALTALKAMNAASGRENFGTITGVIAQNLFRRKLNETISQRFPQEMQKLKLDKQKNSP